MKVLAEDLKGLGWANPPPITVAGTTRDYCRYIRPYGLRIEKLLLQGGNDLRLRVLAFFGLN